MKKNILIIAILLLATFCANAQITFVDSFETYNAGAALGPQSVDWTTWSGTQGGADDINVSSTGAHSGTKCLYFSSTSTTGGPSDIVLPFGGVHTSGHFVFSAWFKVASGKNAYFDLQGNATVGQVWAINCFMNAAGVISLSDNANNIIFSGAYPNGAWYKLTIDVNLTTNVWSILVNGNAIGSFANSSYQVASLDIYAADNTNSFWVDDVSYSFTPMPTPTGLDAAMFDFSVANGLATQARTPKVKIRNVGATAINSFDITVNQNGTNYNQSFTGLNIASMSIYTVSFTTPFSLVTGVNNYKATVTNVNSNGFDADTTNDYKQITILPVQPAAGKVVVAEEATGTWCQWCPRGAVYVDSLSRKYAGFFQGIAVHNNDPMLVVPYDSVMGTLISGFPTALVDRGTGADPSTMEPAFLQRIVLAPSAVLLNGASFDAVNQVLNVSVTTNFQQAVSGNYALACVLVEDSVKGMGSTWSQSNAYSGGASGVMGGFETKANPVPYQQMKYDHVARAIAPSFGGIQNAYGASVNSGQSFVHNFSFAVGNSWNLNKVSIVSLLIAPDGKIDNAGIADYNLAINNGYVLGINNEISKPQLVQVFPNPTNNISNVYINLATTTDVVLQLFNTSGSMLLSKTYTQATGLNNYPINLSALPSGIYILKAIANGQSTTVKLSKN